ncbi:MAG TPA: DUF6049 family protein [Phycicoccus sp.]|nr:DUF6049 family protein [Phycicoccus sp.]
MTRPVARRRGLWLALVVTLFLWVPAAALPLPHAAAHSDAAPRATAHSDAAPRATATPLTLSLATITPTVATADQSTSLTVTVSNPGTTAYPGGTAQVVRGDARLATQSEVDAWATDRTPASGAVLATAAVPALAAGAQTAITLTLPRGADLTARSSEVLPVSVEVGSIVVHTFVAVVRAKEFEPLSLAWLVPLTPDPDPVRYAAPSPQRWHAWQAALATGARLDRIVTSWTSPEVTLAVDADLIAPDSGLRPGNPSRASPTPSASVTSSPSASVPTGGDLEQLSPVRAEALVRAAGAARLRAALAGQALTVLPRHDPDLDAVAPDPAYASTLRGAQAAATEVAASLGGTTDLEWPMSNRYSDEQAARYAAATGAAGQAVVVDRDALEWRLDQGDAGRRSVGGIPLLAREPALSAAATTAARADAHGWGRLTFLAHSYVLLNESPGLARTVLVAPARDLDPDPAATAALLDTARTTPWLATTTVANLVTQARRAPAATAPVTAVTPPAGAPGSGPLAAAAQRTTLAHTRSQAATLGQIRSDGGASAADWAARLDALTATGWRSNPAGFQTALESVRAEVAATADAVRVAPQTINFLADSGRVQVTVLNTLDVPVTNVRVRLVPGNSNLRIEGDTKEVSIGAQSRATVTYDATAIAAGQVLVDAQVLGPLGAPVGPTTTVLVRVSPTGAGVYWSLGVLTLVVFLLGLQRNRRRRGRAGDSAPAPPANAVNVEDTMPLNREGAL